MKILFVILAVLMAVPAHAFYPQWSQKRSLDSGRIAAIVSGDFNGDGRPDVVTRSTAQELFLYLTNSDGTLSGPAATIQSGGSLSGPVVADVNGDAKLDVIFGDSAAPPEGPADVTSLVVRPGNGDGTFGAPIRTLLSFSPTLLARGDFDEDGIPDLAIASYASAILTIWLGDGDGTFRETVRFSGINDIADVEVGDIDDDGNADIAVAYLDARPFRIYFGRGDATFDAPVDFASPGPSTTTMALADLNADRDLEVLFCDFSDRSVSVAVNAGSRTFASPVRYGTPTTDPSFGDPRDLVASDINEDGHVDVVVVLTNSVALATYPGNGDGTLRNPLVRYLASGYSKIFPFAIALADFTGDDRPDLALGSITKVGLVVNRSGDVTVAPASEYPTVSAGQTTTLLVSVCPVARECFAEPYARGRITIESDGVEIASGPLSGAKAEIELPVLPLGTHAITARYSGDDEYHPAVSGALQQHVIAEKTTTTVSSNAGGAEVEYGENWVLTADITSPLPDPLHGSIWLFTNGVRSQYANSAPTVYWSLDFLSAGRYEFQAAYEGNATQPPSTSEVFTQVVRKARTSALISGNEVVRAGVTGNVFVQAHAKHTAAGITDVRLYAGSTLLARTPENSDWIEVSLPVGVHYLEAVYDGNENFEPARSAPFRYTVVPSGFVIDAYATGNTVRIAAFPTSSSGFLSIRRRVGNGPWGPYQFMSSTGEMTETNLPAGVYSYQVEQRDYARQLIGTSTIDTAIVTDFTDDPLRAGTTIKASHLADLVSATNMLLAAGGASPIAIENDGAGQLIRAEHLVRLRAAVNTARVTLGLAPMVWAREITTRGVVRAADVMELRDAIR